MILDQLFEYHTPTERTTLSEGVMDRLKNIYMSLVYDMPMGTPDSEFLAHWQRIIKSELGQNIDVNTLAKLRQNFQDRYRTMSGRGDVRTWNREMGVRENAEYRTKQVKVFKDRAGNPIGEIGIDLDASPGNDDWYCHHYATGYNVLGFENAAEARRELQYVHKHPEEVDESVSEARHFRTAYGWAGGYNEKTGKKYKHPEQARADREAKKQQKSKKPEDQTHWNFGSAVVAEQGVSEGVNAKQIKKDLDAGMSYDAVIGKHANKRMANTDEIRRVIQQHAWEKRMKRPKEQGVAEAIPSHIRPSDIPPAMRNRRLTMKDIEAERPQGAYRFRVGDKEFMDRAAADQFARGTGQRVERIREAAGQKKSNARIERILKQLRARHPQAQDDLEALIYDFRTSQGQDRQDISRLDQENDAEEADIERLERILANLKQQRELAEKRDRTPGKISRSEDPCWKGYHMVGTKKKAGREVPNCVPGAKGATNEAQGIRVRRSGPNETVVTA